VLEGEIPQSGCSGEEEGEASAVLCVAFGMWGVRLNQSGQNSVQ